MRIKIVASRPQTGQDGIEPMIGKEYPATVNDEGDVVIENCAEFGGTITVNPGEWIQVRECPDKRQRALNQQTKGKLC